MIPEHCSTCGLPYFMAQLDAGYPITCRSCDHMVWDNPIPVVVCVQPVAWTVSMDHCKINFLGLAVAKRAIEPRLGTWNMIGGHVENGETFEEAARREWHEETGLEGGDLIGITGSYANGKGHVLVAVQFTPIELSVWEVARLCPENSEFSIWTGVVDAKRFGFPIHDTIATQWSRNRFFKA